MPKEKTPKPWRSATAVTQASTRSTRATISNEEGNAEQPASPANITRQVIEQEAVRSSFSGEQLAQVSSLVSNAVQESLPEDAQRAAKSAVELSRQQISNSSQEMTLPASAEPSLPPQMLITPSNYVQSSPDHSDHSSIEPSKFFNLSKLPLENLNMLENGDISLVMGHNQELELKMTNHTVKISKVKMQQCIKNCLHG